MRDFLTFQYSMCVYTLIAALLRLKFLCIREHYGNKFQFAYWGVTYTCTGFYFSTLQQPLSDELTSPHVYA